MCRLIFLNGTQDQKVTITDELNQILQEIWADLEQGAGSSKAAFHTATLGTVENGFCSLRTVVLRGVEPAARALICHSDVRSSKIKQIEANPAVSWLFYAPERKVQLRVQAIARVHYNDDFARQHWQQTNLSSRRAYTTSDAPGTRVEAPSCGLPAHLLERVPTLEESESGWPNFAVIVTTVQKLDWLYLDAKGHHRAQFGWLADQLQAGWVLP